MDVVRGKGHCVYNLFSNGSRKDRHKDVKMGDLNA